jgi:hypothetical protein
VTDTSGDDDTTISESGGTMQRLSGASRARPVDLAVLEQERNVGAGDDWRPAGSGAFLAAGDPVMWRYGRSIDPMRVVRDDERGLVAWLADDTELVSWHPADGRSIREVPLAERFEVERSPKVGRWRGGGVLRIAPTGRPWSVWVFWEDDDSFAGHYVNLELPHRRNGAETATRDLTLDLWLEPDGTLWLKDADELEAGVAGGRYSSAMADEVRAAAEWARAELVEGADWPLDEEWQSWRPPAGWTVPALPDSDDVRAARAQPPT